MKFVKLNAKMNRITKKCKACEIKCSCLEYIKRFDESLKKRFANTYKLSNHDNRYVYVVVQNVYLYEYMDHWKKCDET